MNSLIRTYLLTALLVTCTTATAQSWLDYDQALADYPLLQSRNAATLTTFSPADSSQLLMGDVRLTARTSHGHLDGPDVAPHSWEAGALVRSIYRMSREEGLSNEQIAEKMGLQKKTVENHINLALRDIREMLKILILLLTTWV